MAIRIVASVVGVLALSAGAAYAATQFAASDGTQVCVGTENGLMRVASTCRASEYRLTIGGGSTSFRRVEVMQDITNYVPPSGAPDSTLSLSASCNPDEKVAGGGALGFLHLVTPSSFVSEGYGFVRASWPSSDTEWSAYFAGFINPGQPGWGPGTTKWIKVWAICAS